MHLFSFGPFLQYFLVHFFKILISELFLSVLCGHRQIESVRESIIQEDHLFVLSLVNYLRKLKRNFDADNTISCNLMPLLFIAFICACFPKLLHHKESCLSLSRRALNDKWTLRLMSRSVKISACYPTRVCRFSGFNQSCGR